MAMLASRCAQVVTAADGEGRANSDSTFVSTSTLTGVAVRAGSSADHVDVQPEADTPPRRRCAAARQAPRPESAAAAVPAPPRARRPGPPLRPPPPAGSCDTLPEARAPPT